MDHAAHAAHVANAALAAQAPHAAHAAAGSLDWFTGYGRYHNLVQCMDGDTLWIAITVALDLAVAAGYALIAMHWWRNARHLPDVPAKRALGNMRNIFVFCGLCGYAFIPIKMFWPAWRLYDLVMFVLVYFTWKYAWNAKDLRVVYSELGRSSRLAEDLEKSREESRRKSFFLNALSHDLRTPLNGLILQANIAQISAQRDDSAALGAALAEIQASTRATAELLDGLLEYARLDGAPEGCGSVTTFDLGGFLGALAARFALDAAQKALTLKLEPPRPPARVTVDRVKLERVLSNLLSNAIKFTDKGGIRVEAEVNGPDVEIHVLDTGVGVEPRLQERLFDEFFQVHNDERDPRKGFGLGLAIARRLARQMGGDVTVTSAAGRGSRFSVVLPGVAVAPGAAGPEQQQHQQHEQQQPAAAPVSVGQG